MNQQLRSALKRLRLSGLLSRLEVRLQEAQGNQLSHLEFLELIVNDEIALREDRAIERRLKAAGFREMKTIEGFDFGSNPSIQRREIMELATCRFIREQRDIRLRALPESANRIWPRRSDIRRQRWAMLFCTAPSSIP